MIAPCLVWPSVRVTGHIGVALGQLREAEVCQLGIAARGDQDVVGLDVAMQDPGCMRRGEPVGDAREQLDHLPPGALLAPGPLL